MSELHKYKYSKSRSYDTRTLTYAIARRTEEDPDPELKWDNLEHIGLESVCEDLLRFIYPRNDFIVFVSTCTLFSPRWGTMILKSDTLEKDIKDLPYWYVNLKYKCWDKFDIDIGDTPLESIEKLYHRIKSNPKYKVALKEIT